MMKRITDMLRRGQQGFTLVELLAVMAILAVLVGIVAPSVTGTRNASIDAQVLQDATQVREAATSHFKDVNEAEVRTPHSVTTTAKMPSADDAEQATDTPVVVTDAEQIISSRWPEEFITTDDSAFTAVYDDEIPTSQSATTTGKIVQVVVLGKDGKTISGDTLLTRYTAVDVAGLVADKYLGKTPAGSSLTSTALTGVEVSNFLWLFEKTSSTTDAEAADDSREVAVFKLVKIDQNEAATSGAATTVNLTYRRIF